MKRTFGASIVFVLSISTLLLLYTNCSGTFQALPAVISTQATGSTGQSVVPTPAPTSAPIAANANVMPVTVGCGYVNEPCVTVTICVPGTSQCQTINNVLLDTGSYGLRIFSQINTNNFATTAVSNLTVSLPPMADPNTAGNTLAECVSYADGSSDWGQVVTADIQLSGELARSVPMQIINASFAKIPSGCTDPDQGPLTTGFNGILGVGLFTGDCGPGCAPGQPNAAQNGIYYSCSSTGSCVGAAVAEANQTTNPVAFLPVDNNGVILELPSVPDAGATTLSGQLILGIGTESNNSAAGTTLFPADDYGNFTTVFNGTTGTGSFIDSGSNALYFAAPASLTACTGDYTGFYCPTTETGFSATQEGATGSASKSVSFSVANASTELAQTNPNVVFDNIAGSLTTDFDWGLPFFLGRNIYVGIQGASSSIGTGPYWAY